MKPALKIEGISKQYRLGHVGVSSLRDDLLRLWAGIQRSPNPFLNRGETNYRSRKSEEAYVWALKDIDFSVNPGEVLGVIGKNGAGKSTLLKILSRITAPTTGKVDVNGRMASLLEVGTGFHPELTGRENIYLNGAILGMRKAEIKSKFDEIVDFSGVERYIDTPVKRYSSGMYVRLAFAVAAHLEPEILVVDEVLAVGDADFQKKCLNKMQEVSTKQGRTILFVSHNLTAIATLCDSSLLLGNGRLICAGKTPNVLNEYRGIDAVKNNQSFNYEDQNFKIISLNVWGIESGEKQQVIQEENEVLIELHVFLKNDFGRMDVTYHLVAETGESLFSFSTFDGFRPLIIGLNKVKCKFAKGFLMAGRFSLNLFLVQNGRTPIFHESNVASFVVNDSPRKANLNFGREPGFIKPHLTWD
jgi:lipopolysaccharide transport system ATP-binding protein